MFPSEFIIPAATEKKPGILVVSDGQRGVYLDQDRGTEMVTVPAKTVAASLVADYILSQPGQDQEAGPGVFFVDGVFTSEQVKERFPVEVAKASKVQWDWWKRLVRLADDTWQTSHIIAQIGDLDRTACRMLGLKRAWLDDSPDSMTKCPVCTTLISTSAIVCFACHVILKPEEYKQYQFAGSPVQPLNAKP
jgi:hypothetical protein